MDCGQRSYHFSVEYRSMMSDHKTATQAPSNFIRGVIERDLANKSFEGKTWAGSPGDASHHAKASIDPA